MKNQYVGDKKDYLKYLLLRRILKGCNWRLMLAWYLTPDDGGNDGNDTGYMLQPDRYRHYDPQLFDALVEDTARSQLRDIVQIEKSHILPSTSFFSDHVPTNADERSEWFRRLKAQAIGHDVVFLDPDNGLEVRSVPYSSQRASKYAFWKELKDLWEQGHSLVLYQHRQRISREAALRKIKEGADKNLRNHSSMVVWGSGVKFVLFFQPKHHCYLNGIVQAIADQMPEHLVTQNLSKNPMAEFVSGNTTTTEIGYLNRNNQRNRGTRGTPGTDHNQRSYKLVCEREGCGLVYGANGSDIFQRKCPRCQNGNRGIKY